MRDLKPNIFASCAISKDANQIHCVSGHTSVRQLLPYATGTEGLRRRGSDALVASLFLSGGLCSDESFLPAHMPWKILIPHSTTTMADTSVAAVNTLSKEATLMLLSASQPR